eukprot:gb/GFBE01040854.1/.p1 GENE.gb/GFBE01040854.1/~~gb/GFBE01040854.1/.p1  ORF type:complete len:229 (+),score=44.35 gb/GFBE01040854.1/:1-687(+)
MSREIAQSMKADIAPYLNRPWSVDLFETPLKDPANCLFGGVCCCIGAVKQRQELLQLTGEPYLCCAGTCPLGPLGEPQPMTPCLCLEAALCPQMALSANRFFVQSRFGLKNTEADHALMQATGMLYMCASYAACFMELKRCAQSCGVDIDGPCWDIQLPVRELILMADCAFLCLNGCMYSQQQVEINAMKANGYGGPPQGVLSALPQKLQAIISNAQRAPSQQFMQMT